MKTIRLFNIQHSELLAHGFKPMIPYRCSTSTFKECVVGYCLTISKDLFIEVVFTYHSADEEVWQQVDSKIFVIYDNMALTTSACCVEDLKLLYRLLTGKELKPRE